MALEASAGWTQDLLPYIHDQMRKGWEDFIKMPVEKKTNKEAYNYQARYQVYKDLLAWLKEEIRSGVQSSKAMERSN